MKYTWLLFDADDTLFDYPRAETSALRHTLEALGLGFRPEYQEIYQRLNRQVWAEFERGELTSLDLRIKRFRLFFQEIGAEFDPQAVSALYLQQLALGSDLLPGAQALIEKLQGRYHLALITNGLAEVQRSRLGRSALANCFEGVFISEELGVAKPSREYFDVVFEHLGQPPKPQVLIIGDSLTSDIKGGVEYGLDTCWYNPRGQTTDLPFKCQIQSLAELPGLLE